MIENYIQTLSNWLVVQFDWPLEPPLLPLLLLVIGVVGMGIALVKIIRPYMPRARYWLNFNRRSAFPSFSGLGSVFIIGVTRISRDRQFLMTTGIFLLTLFTFRSFNWLTDRDWLNLFLVGVLIMSLLLVNKLSTISTQLLEQFPGLPISRGAIDLMTGISGQTVIAVFSWSILSALTRLGLAEVIQLTAIICVGNLVAYSLAVTWQVATQSGSTEDGRLIATQVLVLLGVYQLLVRLPLNTVLIILMVCLTITIITASFREPAYWATIRS